MNIRYTIVLCIIKFLKMLPIKYSKLAIVTCILISEMIKYLKILMLKTWPLCTGAELNLGGRVLGEVEKNSFIALPGKRGHSRLVPLNNCVSQLGRICRGVL